VNVGLTLKKAGNVKQIGFTMRPNRDAEFGFLMENIETKGLGLLSSLVKSQLNPRYIVDQLNKKLANVSVRTLSPTATGISLYGEKK